MSKKQKAPKAPKTVQPMDKKKKSILIWTITGLAVAGIATGITVPLVLASQKEKQLLIFNDEIMKAELAGGLTGEQLQHLLDNAGLADVSLLNEITYQSSFYLYDKEQKGSLKSQMNSFMWDSLTMSKGTGTMFSWSADDAGTTSTITWDIMMDDKALFDAKPDELSEIAKVRKQIVTDFPTTVKTKPGDATYTPIYDTQTKFVDANTHKFINLDTKEGRAPQSGDDKYQTASTVQADKDEMKALYDKDLARYNDLNAQLKTKKELVNKSIDKMLKLDVTLTNSADYKIKVDDTIDGTANDKSGGIDYKSTTFSADYPQVLLPRSEIREKQQKVFNDMKNAVISSYDTNDEGQIEWAKQMPTKFDGATSEAQAVDSLVHKQISTTAFARFEMAINSDYTVKQYKSNIFKDVLGEYSKDIDSEISGLDVEEANKNGVGIKIGASDADKVYFFGTKSKDPMMVNALKPGSEILEYIERINNTDLDLISINNAIFPIKQGTAYDAPWTIVKDDITKLFQTIGTGNTLPINQWGEIFGRPTTDELKVQIDANANAAARLKTYQDAKDAFETARNTAMEDEIAKEMILAAAKFNALADKSAFDPIEAINADQTAINLLIAYEDARSKMDAPANDLWTKYLKAIESHKATPNQAAVDAAKTAVQGNTLANAVLTTYDAAIASTTAKPAIEAIYAIDQDVVLKAYKDAWLKINNTANAASKALYKDFNDKQTAYLAAYDTAAGDSVTDDITTPEGLVNTYILSLEQNGDPMDKEIIGRASGTTDGTRWNSGDLGLMSSLNYIKGMTNGWAAGVTGILANDENAIYRFPGYNAQGALLPGLTKSDVNVLEGLTNTIIVQFHNLAVDKARLGQTGKITIATPGNPEDYIKVINEAAKTALFGAGNDAATATAGSLMFSIKNNQNWNADVKDFVTSLTDEEINRTFGAAIRDYFANLPAEMQDTNVAGIETVSGLPVVIEIKSMHEPDATSGIYMTFTEEFGIHVMRVNTGTSSLIDRIVDDLQTAAEEQSTTKITTDYAKLLTEKLTLARKVQMIMTQADGSDDLEFKEFLLGELDQTTHEPKNEYGGRIKLDIDGDKDGTDGHDTNQEVWDKSIQLIESINASEEITTVNAIPTSTLSTWLSGRIDSRLSGNPLTNGDESMDPDDIYNDIQRIGGN